MHKLVLLLVFTLSSLSAAIFQTDTFEPFFKACVGFTEKSLVVFDVDQVIIEPRDAIMRQPNQRLLWELRLKYASHLTQAQIEQITSIVQLQESTILIDPYLLPFLEEIKRRKIPVIGLTATSVKGYGKIPSIPDWRIYDLLRFGISFSSSFQEHPFIELTQLMEKGASPLFKSGILFTGGYSKGDVLEAFLDTVHFLPDKVLFVDDLMYNLVSVHDALDEMGVEAHLFHYLGANKIPNTIDPQVADFQIKTLVENEVWLSDEQARALLIQQEQDFAKLREPLRAPQSG